MSDCIFCKIVEKKIPTNIEFEDDNCIGFKDIQPVAPVHYLFIPKKHVISINEMSKDDIESFGKILFEISNFAKKIGVDKTGFRVVANSGKDAAQSVFHLHFHLLAGREFGWPPG